MSVIRTVRPNNDATPLELCPSRLPTFPSLGRGREKKHPLKTILAYSPVLSLMIHDVFIRVAVRSAVLLLFFFFFFLSFLYFSLQHDNFKSPSGIDILVVFCYPTTFPVSC